MNKLEEFQKKNGLVSDGILGKKTLRKMQNIWGLTDTQVSHFAGQISHETGNFKYEEENLNYSAEALLVVFGKYFKSSQAQVFARKPEKIANRVYANRMGNGDECSGDGWKFRGRGAIQLTGRNNYEIFANKMRNLQILECPSLVIEKHFFDVALFYFKENRLWHLCDVVTNESIVNLTRRINGGTNGLKDRITKTKYFYSLL